VSDLKFQYGLFIGDHMINGALKVKVTSDIEQPYYTKLGFGNLEKLTHPKSTDLFKGKPLVKSLKSLTDEEWLFIFCGNDPIDDYDATIDNIHRTKTNVSFGYGDDDYLNFDFNKMCFEFIQTMDNYDIQALLNRMHSLHRIPNYEALLEAGVILDAGDCYGKQKKELRK